MRGLGMALAAFALAAPGDLREEDGPAEAPTEAAISYVCRGTDLQMNASRPMRSMRAMKGAMRMKGPKRAMPRSMTRVKVELEVVVAGATVRARPPDSSTPLLMSPSPDGWYVLTDAAVSDTEIRGRLPYGPLMKPWLVIDRTTGKATLAEFHGFCVEAGAPEDEAP